MHIKPAVLRITKQLRDRLERTLFTRYPDQEWGAFFLFGVRETDESVVFTLADLIEPVAGDVSSSVDIVEFREPYTVRAALTYRKIPLFVGVAHSHPQDFSVAPSRLDDEMDTYFSEYFSGFRGTDTYLSIILARTIAGNVRVSGRGTASGRPIRLTKLITVADDRIESLALDARRIILKPFNERLGEFYGEEARERLASARVAVIGCGGTGSAAAHVLARAGVSDFVLVDPERVQDSNLERLHGMYPRHLSGKGALKVTVVRDLIQTINPQAKVLCIEGNAAQRLAQDHIVQADVALNCTDSTHSRVAAAEMAYRYLLPVLDVGVLLDGKEGRVNAEVTQIAVYRPGGACAYCRDLIDSWRLTVELMSDEEKERRKSEAVEAIKRGEDGGRYWHDVAQIHTVGHLTTMAGALTAGYAIGWLCGKFTPPYDLFQVDVLAKFFNFAGMNLEGRKGCACCEVVGYADQGAYRSVIAEPGHWPPVCIV